MGLIRDSVVIANGKGGVGKTTTTLNLATEAASNGTRGICVDLDPQANLTRHIARSVDDSVADEKGESLARALMGFSGEVNLWRTGRPGLDLVAGGPAVRQAATASIGSPEGLAGLAARLSAVLADLAEPGTVIWIDTPPSSGDALADAAAMVGEWLLIPTEEGLSSIDGVGTLIERILETGSQITPIGVLLFGLDRRATRINDQARQELHDGLGGAIKVLNNAIRHSRAAQRQAEQLGLGATEFAEFADVTEIPWYKAIKDGTKPVQFPANRGDLAADWRAVAEEVQDIISSTRARS